jgi:hypothetical protein
MKKAAHPALYDPGDERPMLRATRCETCGSTCFPPLGVGCEVCGATPERLVSVTIAATGVLHSVATVHLHMGSDIAAPFGVAEIQLDDGPLIRGILADRLDIDVIGRRVAARWGVVHTDAEGNEVVEPRFALVAERENAEGAA